MQYLALNGFRHSLTRYFNSKVICIEVFNWTERLAIQLACQLTEPTTLIGFSDGATAALTAACHSRQVVAVYAHSPMTPRSLAFNPRARITLFRTKGDTTPTFKHTLDIHIRAESRLLTLDPVPHEPVRDIATFIMKIRGHQFRNCLPELPPGLTP